MSGYEVVDGHVNSTVIMSQGELRGILVMISAITCEGHLINQRQALYNVTQDIFSRYELERYVLSLIDTIANTSRVNTRATPIFSHQGFVETLSDDADNDNNGSSFSGHFLLAVAIIIKAAPSLGKMAPLPVVASGDSGMRSHRDSCKTGRY